MLHSLRSWVALDVGVGKTDRTNSLCGYLWKMKREHKILVPQWNRRWFTIEGPYLRWYENESAVEYSNYLNLASVHEIRPLTSDHSDTFRFLINCPEQRRKLVLRASSAAEMEKWIRALNCQRERILSTFSVSVEGGFVNDEPFARNQRKRPGVIKKRVRRIAKSLEEELDLKLEQLDELERSLCQGKSNSIDEVKVDCPHVKPLANCEVIRNTDNCNNNTTFPLREEEDETELFLQHHISEDTVSNCNCGVDITNKTLLEKYSSSMDDIQEIILEGDDTLQRRVCRDSTLTRNRQLGSSQNRHSYHDGQSNSSRSHTCAGSEAEDEESWAGISRKTSCESPITTISPSQDFLHPLGIRPVVDKEEHYSNYIQSYYQQMKSSLSSSGR